MAYRILKPISFILSVFSAVMLLGLLPGSMNKAGADMVGRGGGRGGGGNIPRRKAGGAFSFPKYPHASTKVGGAWSGPRVESHADSLGNRVTADHMNRVDFAHGRSEGLMRNNVHVTDVVRVGRARFTNFYRPAFDHRTTVINDYVHRYDAVVLAHPPFLNVWHHHYFYGGLYWGFHPILDIDSYFYNPMVYWFYAGAFDAAYYRNWYGTNYEMYPELHQPFEYHGVYYPTENLRQLLFGVSAMTVDKQVRFRDAMNIFTQRVAQNMANGLGMHVGLSTGDIVVTHYEIIGYDDAVDLEGLVTFGGTSYNYKGVLDLEAPDQTDVFVPATWDKNPNPEQLARLDALNGKIAALKGEPLQPVGAEPETMVAPSPGAISADPQHK